MDIPSDHGVSEDDASLIEDGRLMSDAADLWAVVHEARKLVAA